MEVNNDLDRDIPVLDWESHLAERTKFMRSSAIRELLKITQDPEIISFAGGLPAPDVFPIREVEEACTFVVREMGKKALQYSATEGYGPLKEFLADSMHKYGVPALPENVLLTNGSQQALDLIGRIFIDPGRFILTGRPTYLGAIQAWQAYQARFHTMRVDEKGMVVDEIEHAYEKAVQDSGRPPAFLYVLPNFHNPAGTTLPLERRIKLAEVATKLDIAVVEDDPYGQLRYEGEDIPPICTLIPERTIYLGTFSKTMAPGLRLGWIVAPESLMRRLIQAKQGCDLHTGTLVQYIANDICQRGILKPHIKKIRRVYKKRRDTMLDALAEFWPAECHWTDPEGGLFLWANVPESIDTNTFLREKALLEKVAYVPGINFYPNADGGNTAMRLNFSYAKPDVIVEGIKRLGIALKKELAGK
ncbi:MAG TPA: PLP-dependent aminotransferase family protein [Chloroflexi bacterium]|nr:MAG: aminotransferase [Chloroflexota bacterium]HDD55056.1 PLP-dependent aminotransferase family protein [Chloroflexota bacterium]